MNVAFIVSLWQWVLSRLQLEGFGVLQMNYAAMGIHSIDNVYVGCIWVYWVFPVFSSSLSSVCVRESTDDLMEAIDNLFEN